MSATKIKKKTAQATKSAKATAPAKPVKGKLTDGGEVKAKKVSALDAAAKVLGESNEPLNTKQLVDAMAAAGLWTSPGGKTPHATLFSAILREITTKGSEARFKKTERGHFAANG